MNSAKNSISTVLKNNQTWSLSILGSAFILCALMALAVFSANTAYASDHSTLHKSNNARIVAIDGSISEIVFALGKGDLMVGRDTTTTYPEAASKLPSVGYMRMLSAEGILSLKPTLVLATKDAKPQNVLTRLKDAGVHIEIIDNEYTPKGVELKIRQIAKILKVEAKGEQLAQKVYQSVKNAQLIVQKALHQNKTEPASALFILNMRGNNMMVAGKGSRADIMMQLAGITNPATEHFHGYKPLTAEAAIQFNPDYLLTMEHGIEAAGGKEAILNTPAVKMTNAGQNKNLILVDDNFLMFGPRIGEAIEMMVHTIYKSK